MHLPIIYLSILFLPAHSEFISPCPDLFKYETTSESDGSWYGTITLLSESQANEVILKINLDRPSLRLTNWFGRVETKNSQQYTITRQNYNLVANVPSTIRILVWYNQSWGAPKLTSFQLNNKTVCPENNTTEVEPKQIVWPTDIATTTTATTISIEDNIVNKQTCGTISIKNSSFAHQRTTPGQWPWRAAIFYTGYNKLKLENICGATLISESHVLTAAHCVTKPETTNPVNASQMMVFIGKYSLEKFGENIQEREISEIFVHPQYYPRNFLNNIAILKFKNPIKVTNFVRPCCLWENSSSTDEIMEKSGTIVGWGFDSNGPIPDNLRYVNMSVVDTFKCVTSDPDLFSRYVFDTNFCATFDEGINVCVGQSGDGILFPKSDEGNTIWRLRGIISLSIALQRAKLCDSKHNVVFTDVAKYLDWVQKIISE